MSDLDQKSMPPPENSRERRAAPKGLSDQKSMPPPGICGVAPPFFGSSTTSASVVMMSAEMDAASWSAVRTTLAGSMMPDATMSTYCPVWAL